MKCSKCYNPTPLSSLFYSHKWRNLLCDSCYCAVEGIPPRPYEIEICTECGREITPAEFRLGWPIPDGDKLLCPSCYGDEAWCAGCGSQSLLIQVSFHTGGPYELATL
jgi:hypothetical protein